MAANSVDPDQTPRSVASDLGLHCLQGSICPNILGYYGTSYWYDGRVIMKGVVQRSTIQ